MRKLLAAGFAATVLMTALMYMAPLMRMPKMDIAAMLGTMFLASPGPAFWLGLMLHLMMGTVLFPAVYHLLFRPLSGGGSGRGLLFGLLLWAAVNMMVMPMIGRIHPLVKNGMMPAPGFLMLKLGVLAPIGSFIGHLLYGVVLGKLAGPKTPRLQLRAA